MSKNQQKKSKEFNINLVFKIAYAVVTVFVVGFVLFICTKPFQINTYEEMKQVSYSEYKDKKPETYYVMIYSENFEVSNWYEDIATEYADFVRTHSGMTPIYGYDYDAKGNGKIRNDLNITEENTKKVFQLLKIENGTVSEKFADWDDIHNELTDAMNLDKKNDAK